MDKENKRDLEYLSVNRDTIVSTISKLVSNYDLNKPSNLKLNELKRIKYYYGLGLDIETDLKNDSLLNNAVKVGWSDLVDFCISEKAYLDFFYTNYFRIKDGCFEGINPLMNASFKNNLEIVKKLVNAGAYINAVSPNGINPLWLASFNENNEMVEFLIKNGAIFPFSRISEDYSRENQKIKKFLKNCFNLSGGMLSLTLPDLKGSLSKI